MKRLKVAIISECRKCMRPLDMERAGYRCFDCNKVYCGRCARGHFGREKLGRKVAKVLGGSQARRKKDGYRVVAIRSAHHAEQVLKTMTSRGYLLNFEGAVIQIGSSSAFVFKRSWV